jgi:predicted SAM-dependent methyltransferase
MEGSNAQLARWAARYSWDDHTGPALAPCKELEPVDIVAPFTRQDLQEIGVCGIQFGSWDGRQSSCLNTDIIPLSCGDTETEDGRIYRVDGESYFVRLDACNPLPFAADSIDWIYAEHMIEHLKLMDAMRWTRELKRILRAGGLLRVTTPDLGKYAAGYLHDEGFFARHRERLVGHGFPMPDRRAFMVNQIFQFYGHHWIYDFDELCYVLGLAGFPVESITERAFHEGAVPEVASMDREFRREETIYIEALA